MVTDLGVFDSGGNGLATSHEVGLWTDGGTLLASTTLAAGTGATLDGHFRYAAIGAITLTAGSIYRVGASDLANGDVYSWNNNGETTNGITLMGDRWDRGSGLLFPFQTDNVSVLVGGNFRAVVPEPGTLALVALGGLLVLSRRRRSATLAD